MKRPSVETTTVLGNRLVCTCHGDSVRWIIRKNKDFEYVHCEHPSAYIIYGDGYIPDYCERCGWRA